MYSRYSTFHRFDLENLQKTDRIIEQNVEDEGVIYIMRPYVYFGYDCWLDKKNEYKTAYMTECEYYGKGSKNKLVPVIYLSREGTDYINACSRLLELKTPNTQLCVSCLGSLTKDAMKKGHLTHKGCYFNGGLCDKVKDQRDEKRRMLNAELCTQYKN